jgi:hypothetical protein
MATKPAIAPGTAPNLSSNLMRLLSLPWLDRTIAAIACVPLVYGAYYRYQHFRHGLPLVAYVLNVLICIATMVSRRPPKRVTPNPWFWLLAFVASYWSVLVVYCPENTGRDRFAQNRGRGPFVWGTAHTACGRT